MVEICGKKESYICETVKKKKETHASSAVASRAAKVMATKHKCLV